MRSRVAAFGKQAGAQISVALHRMFGSRSAGGFGILMYHRVTDARSGVEPPTWNVPPSHFRRQMEGLLSRGYRIRALRSLIQDARAGKTIAPGTAVITFDDGYRNVYANAWPVLKELNIPATIFVPTAYVDSSAPLPYDAWGGRHHTATPVVDWQPLSWANCREMEASGLVEIGSHSHRHVDFRGDVDGFRRDLATSVALLEERLGRRDFTFSFPYGGRHLGYSGDALMRIAEQSGVICALTTETELAGAGASPFGWGRLEIVAADSASTIAAKLDGWYNWMGHARHMFRTLAPPPSPKTAT